MAARHRNPISDSFFFDQDKQDKKRPFYPIMEYTRWLTDRLTTEKAAKIDLDKQDADKSQSGKDKI